MSSYRWDVHAQDASGPARDLAASAGLLVALVAQAVVIVVRNTYPENHST